MLCAPGFTCLNGQCLPTTSGCSFDYQCPPNKKCFNRACVDLCTNVNCNKGFVCQSGKCVALNPCAAIQCIQGTRC